MYRFRSVEEPYDTSKDEDERYNGKSNLRKTLIFI